MMIIYRLQLPHHTFSRSMPASEPILQSRPPNRVGIWSVFISQRSFVQIRTLAFAVLMLLMPAFVFRNISSGFKFGPLTP